MLTIRLFGGSYFYMTSRISFNSNNEFFISSACKFEKFIQKYSYISFHGNYPKLGTDSQLIKKKTLKF